MREESDKTDSGYEGGTGSKIGGEVVRGRGDGWRRMDARG